MTILYSTSKEKKSDIVHSGELHPTPRSQPSGSSWKVMWEENQSENGFKIDWKNVEGRLHTTSAKSAETSALACFVREVLRAFTFTC